MTAAAAPESEARALAQARVIASSFIAGSVVVPAAVWWFQPPLLAVRLQAGRGVLYAALVVAALNAVGLALRTRFQASARRAEDVDDVRWLLLLSSVAPSGFAEAAAVFTTLAWMHAAFHPGFLPLFVPTAVVLWLAWPRPA